MRAHAWLMDASISPATALKSAVSHLDHANDRLLRAVSGVSGEDLQNALKQLDKRMARLSTMADQTPGMVHDVVRDVQQRVDVSWTEMLHELRTQGTLLSGTLSSERAAATQAIDDERAVVTADAQRIAAQVIHDAGVEVRRLVREALLLVIVLSVVVFGLPFGAGYLVGGARRNS